MLRKDHCPVQSFRLPVAAVLALVVVVLSILFDACRTEGSLPLLKNIKGDTAAVKAQLRANVCCR